MPRALWNLTSCENKTAKIEPWEHFHATVDQEIFIALHYNVLNLCVFHFRHLSDRWKSFNGIHFTIYGIRYVTWVSTTMVDILGPSTYLAGRLRIQILYCPWLLAVNSIENLLAWPHYKHGQLNSSTFAVCNIDKLRVPGDEVIYLPHFKSQPKQDTGFHGHWSK